MFSYLSSYLTSSGETTTKEKSSKEPNDGEQLNQYGSKFERMESENQSTQAQSSQGEQEQGFMSKLYTKMSGHPSCDVLLQFYKGRKYFKAGDDLKGKICIRTRVEGQKIEHQGVKVSLLGMVLQLPASYTK